jgi:hypothetical protein
MAMSSYRAPHISGYLLAQETNVTCWAACAAALVSARRGRLITEIDALPKAYRGWYTNPQTVTFAQIGQVYGALGFKSGRIDVSSRPDLVQFIRRHAPIIVGSSIVSFEGGFQHIGYHVRVIIGYWGDPDAADENKLQITMFDPSPPAGFSNETGFLFSHFRYQMSLATGNAPGIVGSCWYL